MSIELSETIVRIIFIFLMALNAFFLVKVLRRQRELITDQNTMIKSQKGHLDFFDTQLKSLENLFKKKEELIVKIAETEKEDIMNKLKAEVTDKESREKAYKKIKGNFDELGVLLVYLFLDLETKDYIEQDYFPKMKEGYGREIAQRSLKVARDIAGESHES